MGNESVFEDLTFNVDATDDATVDITLPSFGNPPMQVPQINVSDVKVSGSDGTYTLATTEFSGTTDSGRAVSGTIEGSYADQVLTIRFNLQYGAMPMPMICTFSAPKKTSMTGSLKTALLSAVGLLFPLTGLADTYVGKVLDENGSPLPGRSQNRRPRTARHHLC